MNYEVVIGLETHVELKTESKIFCSCGGHAAAKTPNDCVCPACSGMPGMLPVMNKRVVELAVLAGLMLNCEISRYTTFDKKNYYYPDLPCAYQVTQINHPICTNGCVQVKTSAGVRDFHIKQIHMEEDAGKLVHSGSYSYVDFNRTSVPLIEIVTQPDFRSAEEVITYLTNLKSMFRFSGISECEEGAMRCDVNISVREEGSQEFGVRTEIKNMSSFEAIEKAINYEAQRHMDAIEYELEELVQETRRYDDASGKTFAMRNKETEADYRYFPDANLMPIIIDDEWIEEIKKNVELPVIGIVKRDYEDSKVYITPTMKEVDELMEVKPEIIAIDATIELRPGGVTLDEFYHEIRKKYPDQLLMADCSTVEEALHADELGFDFIGTTLVGYTDHSKGDRIEENDFEIIRTILKNVKHHVIAEGNINTPEKARRVVELGCYSVVVGSIITRPQLITKSFTEEMAKAEI